MRGTLLLFALGISLGLFAQSNNANELYNEGKTYLSSGNYESASQSFAKAVALDKGNMNYKRDYALSLYLKRDFSAAINVITNNIDNKNVDITFFQLGGNIYRALEETKDCEKLYKSGLKKFPKSGPLYNEYGELLKYVQRENEAILLWETGIKQDPGYAHNYYNAAEYYFNNNNPALCMIYGEVFVNMESLSEKASAMKSILLKAYKEKLMASTFNENVAKTEFTKSVIKSLAQQKPIMSDEVSIETLTMMRTKFILDWSEKYAAKYPYKLFEYLQQLLKEGMFDAYNHWLFGPAENLPAYDEWIKNNIEQHQQFYKFQQNRVFKILPGQYYQ